MKPKILKLLVASCFLGLLPFKTVALNYTITFTGTGASPKVENVMVQNLTKGTSVTVPSGNVLNLSDGLSALDQLITTMIYTAGDRLLYKGISGNYSTIVTDIPTDNKTTNFNFVACKDADENNYKVVTIGTQTWMAENLKTTKYNDGTAIPNVTANSSWVNFTSGAYSWYNNDATTYYDNAYGALYNWYTVNTGKLAPTGWHVATDTEWNTLENYLIENGYNYDGSTSGDNYAKSLAATTDWATDSGTGTVGNDLTKNNRSGFSALPGGFRDGDDGSFTYVGGNVLWWSSTESKTGSAWNGGMFYARTSVHWNYNNMQWGFYVRCVRDF